MAEKGPGKPHVSIGEGGNGYDVRAAPGIWAIFGEYAAIRPLAEEVQRLAAGLRTVIAGNHAACHDEFRADRGRMLVGDYRDPAPAAIHCSCGIGEGAV